MNMTFALFVVCVLGVVAFGFYLVNKEKRP